MYTNTYFKKKKQNLFKKCGYLKQLDILSPKAKVKQLKKN